MTNAPRSFGIAIVGAGPAGMMAAIVAARAGQRVTVFEMLPRPGAKLRVTGGGRCNLTNTLDRDRFVARCGRHGRFMLPALRACDGTALTGFFAGLGVATHAPDGFHVFPVGHEAGTVAEALERELDRLGVTLWCGRRVTRLLHDGHRVTGVAWSPTGGFPDSGQPIRHDGASPAAAGDRVPAPARTGTTPTAAHGSSTAPVPGDGQAAGPVGESTHPAAAVIVTTGGLSYPTLGATGDGHRFATATGHRVTRCFPALVTLRVREDWVGRCRADTIGKARLRVTLPGLRRAPCATGDLIFTANGIRGPVVLDLSREITPLLAEHAEVPLAANLVGGRDEATVRAHLVRELARDPNRPLAALIATLVPRPLATELCRMAGAPADATIGRVPGPARDRLEKLLAATPLTVIGDGGWSEAMVTRGGVALTEVAPETLASRRIGGLFFAGEVLDLDGPCGGFNLQWAFASGCLAGRLGAPAAPEGA